MTLLTGHYRRSLDDKSRLAIPKPLRAQLADSPLFANPGLDACLALYPEDEFARVADRLAANSPAARATRDYSRLFFSQAERLTLDGQGRIRLPATLVERARLGSEIVLVGVRDHLEVWNSEAWDAFVSQRDVCYDELAERAFEGPSGGEPQAQSAPTAKDLQPLHGGQDDRSPARPR
ncbi:MAG: division/cell wall cluster transcriptional repressor MraZ [Pirellulales bacterium]|nr:division/cell wall cluster transcriptional repressor MraZ [Pirellulales bacterium]